MRMARAKDGESIRGGLRKRSRSPSLTPEVIGSREAAGAVRTSEAYSAVDEPFGALARRLISGMTEAQKIAAVVMGYGDVHVVPTTGAIIVNQTHLTAKGVPMLRKQVAAARQKTGVPVLVGADQEGGKINRLKRFPPTSRLTFPSAQQMQGMTDNQIQAEGAKTGKALKLSGVNLLLGPVLDAADPGTLMYRQSRSFGSNPGDVIRRAQSFVTGLRSGYPELVILGKHFPGYNVLGNSDNSLVHDAQTLSQVGIRSRPFFKVLGLDGIMVSSIRYDNIDPQPACFSRVIIGQYRAQVPNGLIITDDLAARGLSASSSVVKSATRAFLAGVDIMLTLDAAKVKLVERGVSNAINDSSASPTEREARRRQLDASVARVLRLALRIEAGTWSRSIAGATGRRSLRLAHAVKI
jgi:beta-glucosidase-like glycosyl hydrolase